MKMSAIILGAGLLMTGLPAAAQPPAIAAQPVRYDPFYGNHYDRGGWGRQERRWDRRERHRDRQQRRWSRQRGYYGYGYGYGRAPRCWAEWQYGRRVKVCG